jgi:hypothetical protein
MDHGESDNDAGRLGEADRDLAATTRDVATEVADRASSVAARLPDAPHRHAARSRRLASADGGSDEMLAVGTSLSLGLAIGMLIGGAP